MAGEMGEKEQIYNIYIYTYMYIYRRRACICVNVTDVRDCFHGAAHVKWAN